MHPDIERELLIKYPAAVEDRDWTYYRELIKQGLQSSKDRYGFINYGKSFKALRPAEALYKKMLSYKNQGSYHEVWYINRAILTQISAAILHMDDSSGIAGGLIYGSLDELLNLAKNVTNQDLRNEMFKVLGREFEREKYRAFGFEQLIFQILTLLADDNKKLQQIQKRLDTLAEKIDEETGYSRDIHEENLLDMRIQLMEKVGNNEEAVSLLEDNKRFWKFREKLIERAFRNENLNEAKALAREGLQQSAAEKQYGLVTYCLEWMAKIAQKEQNTADYRKYILRLFENTRDPGYYKKWKGTFSDVSEQTQAYAKYIENLRQSSQDLHQKNELLGLIFNHEQDWDSLVEIVDHAAYLLDRYGWKLLEHRPKGILPWFKKRIRQEADHASERKSYKAIAEELRKIAVYSGGREMAQHLFIELQDKYSNRPAMIDELNKVKNSVFRIDN